MSDIMEKTFYSIQNLIVGNSRKDFVCSGFQNLVETMSNVRSKREQDLVIQKEISSMQYKLGQPDVKPHHVRDCLVRAIYCEMLGYAVPFVYIHAIKHAQHGSLANKRTGYLAATIFLHENHELVILLINTIQKDLKSTNILENCMALTAATCLVSAEMAHSVIDLVEEKLGHRREIVRKRAVLTLHHFLLSCPASVRHLIPRVKACLGDSDPDVVFAVIHFMQTLASTDVSSCKDIVEPLVRVLNQILHRKLPIDFDYHGLPGPWIQIDILRLLSMAGHGDAVSSNLMYASLKDVMLRVDVNHNIGYAVLYECVCTAAHIYPNDAILEIASSVIGKFLQSANSDMKYMGLKALSQMIQNIHPSLATQHQSVVMSCLRHSDASVRSKTLDLLFYLTNPSNIQVVCPKILDHLSHTTDEYTKNEIIQKTLILVNQHSPDPKWSFQTINSLVLNAAPASLSGVIDAIQNLLKKGNEEVHILAVETYYTYLLKLEATMAHNEVVHLAITVVRGYYPLCPNITTDNVFQLFSGLLTNYLKVYHILTSILLALKKIVIHNQVEVGNLLNQLEACLSSPHPLVRQQAGELCQVLRNYERVKSLFRNDNPCEEKKPFEFDWTLSFLDCYVCELSTSGASPYIPFALQNKKGMPVDLQFVERSIHQYNVLSDPSISSTQEGPPSMSSISTHSASATVNSQQGFNIKLPLDKVKRVWHKEGCDFPVDRSGHTLNPREDTTKVTEKARKLSSGSTNLNTEDDFANMLFGSLRGNLLPATPTANALDSNSSTSSIQRISSDSGPSSNQDSPLDSLSKSLVVKLETKPSLAVELTSPPFTLILKDDCSSEESELTPSNTELDEL